MNRCRKRITRKNWIKDIEHDVSEKKVPLCSFTAVVHHAAVMCWNICRNYFEITVFYYNPNIFPESEFEKRIHEQEKLIRELPAKHLIDPFSGGNYDSEKFLRDGEGTGDVPEGGGGVFRCYELMLREAARSAKRKI